MGTMLYHPKLVCKIKVAYAILHNIAKSYLLPITVANDLREHISFQGDNSNEACDDGNAICREITETYFSQ